MSHSILCFVRNYGVPVAAFGGFCLSLFQLLRAFCADRRRVVVSFVGIGDENGGAGLLTVSNLGKRAVCVKHAGILFADGTFFDNAKNDKAGAVQNDYDFPKWLRPGDEFSLMYFLRPDDDEGFREAFVPAVELADGRVIVSRRRFKNIADFTGAVGFDDSLRRRLHAFPRPLRRPQKYHPENRQRGQDKGGGRDNCVHGVNLRRSETR